MQPQITLVDELGAVWLRDIRPGENAQALCDALNEAYAPWLTLAVRYPYVVNPLTWAGAIERNLRIRAEIDQRKGTHHAT
jgi:hypothetical protein